MRILVDESVWGASDLFGACGEVRTFSGRTLRHADIGDAEALIVRSVTRVNADLLSDTDVRFVGTVTTGTDHIDKTWLADNSVAFASAGGSNARPVAEYVLASLLLMAERKGFDPRRKTLGVVGVGRVGSIVARWARALGMQVLACDPPLKRQTGSGEYVDLAELSAHADIVTLHVPLTHSGEDATKGMVRSDWLSAFHKGLVFINSSRGEVVRETDLKAAMDSGQVSAAVLDVWCNEPDVNKTLVRRADIASPHVAGYSVEAKARAARMVRDALLDWSRQAPVPPAPPGPHGEKQEKTLAPIKGTARQTTEESPDRVIEAGEVTDSDWLPVARKAVLQACDLATMDAEMRRLAGEDTLASGFDAIRRPFALRREFGAYRIRGCPKDSPAGEFMSEIGFSL